MRFCIRIRISVCLEYHWILYECIADIVLNKKETKFLLRFMHARARAHTHSHAHMHTRARTSISYFKNYALAETK